MSPIPNDLSQMKGMLHIHNGSHPSAHTDFALHDIRGHVLGRGHIGDHHGHGRFSVDIRLDPRHEHMHGSHEAEIKVDQNIAQRATGRLHVNGIEFHVGISKGGADWRASSAPRDTAGLPHTADTTHAGGH